MGDRLWRRSVVSPRLLTRNGNSTDEVLATRQWGFILGVTATALAVLVAIDVARTWVVVIGLIVFGIVFAMNSALHSFLVLAYSNDDGVALDVGFYYSANAAGRLVGTLLSGLLFWQAASPLLWLGAQYLWCSPGC